VAPLYSWTGCYVGGNGGGIWAKTEWNDTVFGSFGDSTASGGLGGLQVGCNYQAGAWVFGVQGDYDWANAKTDNTNVFLTANFPGFGPIVNHTEIKSIASVTGRVGYALDRFLVYGKGGGAWVRADHSFLVGGATVASSSDSSRGGWTAGVGGEYAFNNWLTGFVEWDYYKFDNDNPNGRLRAWRVRRRVLHQQRRRQGDHQRRESGSQPEVWAWRVRIRLLSIASA
jgi:outer membrane immunogenic protein